jgi:DNA-binding NarL/FixJ family response regulator
LKTGTKKILIIDDQKLFVLGFKNVISNIENAEVVGELYDGLSVLPFLANNSVDFIFLDLNMPQKNGLEILAEIRENHPDIFVCILSMYSDYVIAKKCKSLGANAYLTKDAEISELRLVMNLNMGSEFYFSNYVNKEVEINSVKDDNFVKINKLTQREVEIIKLLVKGKTSIEVAEELFISPATVQTHRKNIFNKLKVKKVSELIQQAYENNII